MTLISLFRSLVRARSPKQTAHEEAVCLPSTDVPVNTYCLVSNEADIIAYICSLFPQLEAMGIQYRRNQLHQSEAYIKDIDAPTKPGLFTQLDETNRQLWTDYEDILAEISVQVGQYDRYCELYELDYSPTWNLLLAELKKYQSSISYIGILHHKEVMAGFVSSLPTTTQQGLITS